jgi:hypothetical protein
MSVESDDIGQRSTLKTIQSFHMPAQKPFSNISQAALVGLAILLSPIESTAIEWSAQPSITAGTSVNDNINYTTAPHNTVWGSTVSPQLTLSANSPQSTLSGQAQLNRLDYSDKSALSRTDGLLNLTFTRQYERSQLSLTGNLTRDSTLEELVQTGVVIPTIAQRTSRSLAPSWAYSITERDSVNFGYNYLDVSYSNATTTSSLLDYTVTDPSITLSHAFSEKNKLNLSLDYSDYQSQTPVSLTTPQYQYTTTSAQLGFSRDFTERLSVSLMAGVQKTDSKTNNLICSPFFLPSCFPIPTPETSSSGTGSLFKATLQQAFESSQLTAELSRSLQPTADGRLTQSDRLSGGYNAKLSPTLTGALNMSIYKTQSSVVSGNSTNDRYYTINPALSWQITEWWTANTSYTRSMSQIENGANATDNAINLTMTYNWPKISQSR